uniref:transcription elongation factor A N-terminal and central domain-containing protein n=1 Tax=Centroberyx gerrardi TaxID=166262 RepID=UPI003AAD4BFC
MDAKQIIHCAHQLEKSHLDRSYGSMVTLLGDLDKSGITAEQLQTTDIVKVLYRLLKTCNDAGVKRTVKCLLSKWKRQYSREMGLKCTEDSKSATVSCGVSVTDGGAAGDADERVISKQGVGSTQSQTCEDGASTSSDSSPVRSTCVRLLLAALCSETPDEDEAAELAGAIERHIYELHRTSWVKYKACVRSKVSNLRNPKSVHLRQGLLSGSLSPEAFARMSAEEMAGTDLRRLREEYSSRGMSERQLPRGVEGTPTQKIRCKRCEGSDCRVTQVSRGILFLPAWVRQGGPDEDAMTFVTCSRCGEQWYHSGWVCL